MSEEFEKNYYMAEDRGSEFITEYTSADAMPDEKSKKLFAIAAKKFEEAEEAFEELKEYLFKKSEL